MRNHSPSLNVGFGANLGDRRPHTRGDLAAALRGREDLARVEAVGGAKGGLQAGHDLKVVLGEDPGHVVALLIADAVLAGDGAARGNTEAHDFLAELEHTLRGAGDALVEHDVWMQVAVARVKHVGHGKAEASAGLVDAVEHRREQRTRDDTVEDVVRRRHAPERSERALAPRPKPVAVFLREADADFAGTYLVADDT